MGCDAQSVDLLPSEDDSTHHHIGGLEELLTQPWDLLIAHPPCTYLANSGVRHLHDSTVSRTGKRASLTGLDRFAAMFDGAAFFNSLWRADVPRIAVENPTPHGYARQLIGPYTQAIQPWEYGHGETKRTCLWLKNLPPLVPTDIVEGREHRIHMLPPGPERWKERSRTFQGIADAMAAQWAPLLFEGDQS